ncbi:uncharacterized protein At3g28850-like [Curcuma longa]|uniref:uncharacterized protein At3g28850-like n=1 Tax=Curcuma longa TaxID=136217 RepID=UPI003D9DF3AE
MAEPDCIGSSSTSPRSPLLPSFSFFQIEFYIFPPLLLLVLLIPLAFDCIGLMWPAWGKVHLPRGGGRAITSPSPPQRSPFLIRSSSLKDILSLLDDCEAFDRSNPSTTPSRASSPPPPPPPLVHHSRPASAALLRPWCSSQEKDPFGLPPGEEKRIILYFSSFRVVRRTFEDCAAVRAILRGLRVAVDERDVSMDAGFLRELRGILGGRPQPVGVPQVFIGGRHIGGAEDLRRLLEAGELKRYVEGVAPAPPEICDWCGDLRFLVCRRCSGSRRCYSEKGNAGGAFRACTACNENGLIRCPRCCAPTTV